MKKFLKWSLAPSAMSIKASAVATIWEKTAENPYVQEHADLQASITGKGQYWNQAVQVAESTMTCIMGRIAAYTGKKTDLGTSLETTRKNLYRKIPPGI